MILSLNLMKSTVLKVFTVLYVSLVKLEEVASYCMSWHNSVDELQGVITGTSNSITHSCCTVYTALPNVKSNH